MRLLLLAALLLRIAPPPAADAHCGEPERGAAIDAVHAHHEAPSRTAPHRDCDHCPPAECAVAEGCAAAGSPLSLVGAHALTPDGVITRQGPPPVVPLRSRPAPPPVPPPVIPAA